MQCMFFQLVIVSSLEAIGMFVGMFSNPKLKTKAVDDSQLVLACNSFKQLIIHPNYPTAEASQQQAVLEFQFQLSLIDL